MWEDILMQWLARIVSVVAKMGTCFLLQEQSVVMNTLHLLQRLLNSQMTIHTMCQMTLYFTSRPDESGLIH